LGIAVTKADRTIPYTAKQNIDIDLQSTIHNAKEQLQNWYTIHQQFQNHNIHSDPVIEDGIVPSNGHEPLRDPTTTTTTAAISLDQLWEFITSTTNNNNNALYHWYMVETRLSGRTAADAAFWFAMSGIDDPILYELLVHVVRKELLRFGLRSSCRYKDIIDIVTRCAAAGIRDVPPLEQIVQQCLQNKKLTKKDIPIQSPYFNLHSNECSMLVWHFSTRQRKQRTFLQTASKHYYSDLMDTNNQNSNNNQVADGRITNEKDDNFNNDNTVGDHNPFRWYDIFADPTRPLIIDVGCGMGMSLLGLATISPSSSPINSDLLTSPTCPFPYHLCNCIGVDLSSLSINYANGIAKRWNIHDRLVFVVDEAEHFLDQMLATQYPGTIQRILVQFPTPYRLSAILNEANLTLRSFSDDDIEDEVDSGFDDERDDLDVDVTDNPTTATKGSISVGNTQLPANIRHGGFMVTTELLQKISQLLSKSQESRRDGSDVSTKNIPFHPDFLFQSNCEDVAVLIRNMACQEANFVIHTEMMEVNAGDNVDDATVHKSDILKPTQRTLNWIASFNGTALPKLERASGYGWWMKPILPRNGCTETEVACMLKHVPVHRCILKNPSTGPEIV
jgi:tRNA G46 methylase TrmB